MQKVSKIKLKIKLIYILIIIIILELTVVADNQTRWNSTSLILQRALKLRLQLSLFIDEAINKENNPLTHQFNSKDDWTTLQIVHDLLKPFWNLKLTFLLQR